MFRFHFKYYSSKIKCLIFVLFNIFHYLKTLSFRRCYFFFVPTDVHAGLVEHLGLHSRLVVVIIQRFFQDSFKDHLKLIRHHLESADGTFVFRNNVKTIPCSTGVLKKVFTGRCCLIHC